MIARPQRDEVFRVGRVRENSIIPLGFKARLFLESISDTYKETDMRDICETRCCICNQSKSRRVGNIYGC